MKRYVLVEIPEPHGSWDLERDVRMGVTRALAIDTNGIDTPIRTADVTDHVQLTQDPETVAIVRAMIQMS